MAGALKRLGDFAAFLGWTADDAGAWRAIRQSETTGRPLGDTAWLASLEAKTGRTLAPQKRGPNPKISAFGKLSV